jgi:hypothetical protein
MIAELTIRRSLFCSGALEFLALVHSDLWRFAWELGRINESKMMRDQAGRAS